MALDRPTRRAVLRPGLRLTRRCDGLMQAGLHRDQRVGVTDSPLARRLAEVLSQPDQEAPEDAADLLHQLADLLMDGRALHRLLRENPDHQGAVAAAALLHGDDAPAIWRRRQQARVQVSGPETWCAVSEELLADSGLGLTASRGPADVHLLLHVGEPESSRADELLKRGTAHLWAGTTAGEVAVGPFVDPGRTPCRRCVIAALSSLDPGHALVREQYVGRNGDLPEPEDPTLLRMAVAWAVRDIIAWVDGVTPATWGATVVLPPSGVPVERRYLRQPECGCSWTGAWLAG